jgi:hypothetical protein
MTPKEKREMKRRRKEKIKNNNEKMSMKGPQGITYHTETDLKRNNSDTPRGLNEKYEF